MMSAMMVGVSSNWFGPLEESLVGPESDVPMDRSHLSWLLSALHFSEIFSIYPAVLLADRCGRKACLLMTFPVVAASWLIIWQTRTFGFLLMARMLQGICLGTVYIVAPVYAAEIAEPKVRGRLGAIMTAMWNLGILFTYVVGPSPGSPMLSYESYIFVSCFPGLIFFLAFYQMPESPYFLLMMGEEDAAESALSWLRGDDPVGGELKAIRVSVENDLQSKTSGWENLFFSKQCRLPLFVASVITVTRYLAGTLTVVGYLPETFGKVSSQSTYWATIFFGLMIFITCILATFVTDRFGRRSALLWSLLTFAAANLTVAIYSYLQEVYRVDMSSCTWVLYSGMAIVLTAPRFGLIPVADIIQAEYFPCHVRAAAGAFLTGLGALILIFSMKLYQIIEDNYGPYFNFSLFAFFSFVGFLIISPIMKETANKSLGEIQEENQIACNRNTGIGDDIYEI